MMKQVLSIFVLATSFFGYAQNYQPFSETSSKRFFDSNNPSDDNYFFHADSSTVSGDSIDLFQYHTIQLVDISTIDITGCFFWGGPTGEVLDTTWLGNRLNWNSSTNELRVENEQNEPLSFDFGINLGSASPFYSNGSINYFIEHTTSQIETFLGVSDSVKTFSIYATNAGGSPVSTNLDGFEIKLSKTYGLLSFIDSYNFPLVEKGTQLKGQTNPSIGTYQLTYEECYPWQINDVVQYESMHAWGGSFSPPPCHAFQTLTVIDRIETADSVKLYFSSLVQENNPPTPVTPYIIGATEVFFKKGECISEIPWNGVQNVSPFTTAQEDSSEQCGYAENFISREYFSHYCDSCYCIGSSDGFGSSIEYAEYVKGYGLFRKYPTGYGPIGSVPSLNANMIYSNINGVECGTLWNDLDEIHSFDVELYPNPTSDHVTIKSEYPISRLCLKDFSGRSLLDVSEVDQNTTTISLTDLQKGAYIIEVSVDESVQKRTIFRQ